MIQNLINKNYIIYGSSIILSRGLEFLILFFAAYIMTKEQYGEFEYYKKLIETFSIAFAFGFPSLLMSYTKSPRNKDYFYVLSISFTFLIGLFGYGIALLFDMAFLIIPILFYALFFTGSITQNYILVKNGSQYASIYKIVVSLIFYLTVFCLIYRYNIKEYALVYASFFISPFMSLYFIRVVYKAKIKLIHLKKYYRLFKKLLYGSLTMVISDFANILFLYTDIFIIKLLSQNSNVEMANFSFALNIAAIILIIPTTILQVNIEKLKKTPVISTLNIDKQITSLILLTSIFLILFYKLLVDNLYQSYQETFWLFVLLTIAKIFQSLSNLFGTNLLIQKRYNLNLYINLFFLTINCILCAFLYKLYGIYGIVISSILTLAGRYFILRKLNFKYFKTNYA
ncbi:oligosaccharide flippase family protein [Empedobacter sp. 225-1]|uniref:oligosaccharide flippase family protein n=1 Tax=unclassified Empedobacter TaxID=2643773 RepID=UPI0025771FA2|nr:MULTISPECIES: oligosaccharide flippase family protein [unclassified Empedobacter]MDM1522347.1 oligosaccharide flippase family protein [Empedobacter sp. 225-1]MDM1541844.1 oligosaccharide flippase family protein [Empedobacter sp. 189-2]